MLRACVRACRVVSLKRFPILAESTAAVYHVIWSNDLSNPRHQYMAICYILLRDRGWHHDFVIARRRDTMNGMHDAVFD